MKRTTRILFICLTGLCYVIAQPTAHIYGEKVSRTQVFNVYFTFGDSVAGLTAEDLITTNAGVVSVEGNNRFYSAVLKAENPGTVTVKIPAGAVTAINASRPNTESNIHSVDVQYDREMVFWKVDSDEEWQETGSAGTGLAYVGGEAKATGTTAAYSSITKTYTVKTKPQKLVFKQTPAWLNWTEHEERIGPPGGNAPIFLPIANDDYYFFVGIGDGYGAWHSTDMVNWERYDDIATDPDEPDMHFRVGMWMTSAEYKDGMFYIIGDVPNDQDPHLWTDTDLNDGILPVYSDTAVFADPSDGSDAGLFRNDEDGLFHIIYEDYSPIRAQVRSWDSPFAGHTSSEDCINGFLPHEHTPAVDHRTSPTGEFITYNHPTGPFTYEVHEPEQPAFGDWTVIKVGSQLYLFSDYDSTQSNNEMSVAIHTSSSIYKEFEFIGHVGSGHPDPTCGFAEGQFYLITQEADLTSPGPWVEGVEARAGVDKDGNGTIDQWTDWQKVKETYDHKPGYARVVDVTPADLDLTSLPEGLGFKFEFRVNVQGANAFKPIMDRVEMSLKPVGGTGIVHVPVPVKKGKMLTVYDLHGKVTAVYRDMDNADPGRIKESLKPGLHLFKYQIDGITRTKKTIVKL